MNEWLALALIAPSFIFSYNRKLVIAVASLYALFVVVYMFELEQVGIYYYLLAAIISCCYLIVTHKLKAKICILLGLFASVVCNFYAFIEYALSITYIYNAYTYIMHVADIAIIVGLYRDSAIYERIRSLPIFNRRADCFCGYDRSLCLRCWGAS